MVSKRRVTSPAVEWVNSDKHWYQNDKLHRIDGPAIEWVDGIKEWYIEDKQYTEQEFNDQKFRSRLIPPEMWEI